MTTILDAMRDPNLFGRLFHGDSWATWSVALRAAFGLPMDTAELEVLRRHTGRTEAPTEPAREAWFVAGRRGGKSRVAALVATYLATCGDYRAVLAPGEMLTIPVIAADRRQARTVMRYVNGSFETVPMLRPLIANRTRETYWSRDAACRE